MGRRRRARPSLVELMDGVAAKSLGQTATSAVVWHPREREWWFVVYVGTVAECMSFVTEHGEAGFAIMRGRPGEALDVWRLLDALPYFEVVV